MCFFSLGELLAARLRRQQSNKMFINTSFIGFFLVRISANGFSQHSTRCVSFNNIISCNYIASSGAPTTASVVFCWLGAKSCFWCSVRVHGTQHFPITLIFDVLCLHQNWKIIVLFNTVGSCRISGVCNLPDWNAKHVAYPHNFVPSKFYSNDTTCDLILNQYKIYKTLNKYFPID